MLFHHHYTIGGTPLSSGVSFRLLCGPYRGVTRLRGDVGYHVDPSLHRKVHTNRAREEPIL